MAPPETWPGHHPAEVFPVQFFKYFFEIVNGALRPEVNFPAAALAHQIDAFAHILAVQIEPVAMFVLARGGLSVQLAEQDVSESFGDGGGRAVQQICDPNRNRAVFQTRMAIGVRELFVLHVDSRQSGAGANLAMDSGEDCSGRFEKKRARNINRREESESLHDVYVTGLRASRTPAPGGTAGRKTMPPGSALSSNISSLSIST
jgi:hypothetical protein